MSGSALHMGIVTAQESRAEEREIYFPNHERAMAHYSWPSPDQRSILVVEMDRTAAWQRCRVVPMAGSTPGTQVGPDGGCFAAAWSPEGKWMYFNVEVDNATHLWRQRVPDGKPEQITFGPSEEEGLAVEPDGKSLITSIGNRQSSVWTHDSSGDHALPLEGSAFHAMLSPDGKRLFFLRRQGASPNENELWSRDLASGRSDALVTGQSIQNFFLSPDQTLVAFSVREGNASQIFLAPLDRSSPPRLVAQGGDIVTMSSGGDLIFRQLGEKANYLARIHPDGSGLERILDTPIAERFGASPDGEWVSVSGFAQAEGTFATGTFGVSTKDHLRRRICTGICVVSWSSKGDYLYVSTDRPSTSVGQTLVIPIPHGFGALALPEAGLDRVPEEQIPGLRVIQRGNLYPGPDPGTYTFTTESFQGNLFRVPLH
jgi:hypothetical protein